MDNNELNNNTNLQPNVGSQILMGDVPSPNNTQIQNNMGMQPQNNINLNQDVNTQNINTNIANDITQNNMQNQPSEDVDTIFSSTQESSTETVQPQIQESKQKKNKTPKVIIIILLLAILSIGGYIAYNKFIANKNEPVEPKKEEKVEKKVLLEDSSREVVYTYFDNKIGEYTYNIPNINIASQDASNINKEILDKFEKVYKDAKESGNPESRVGYKYYVNNEIVSLLIYEAFNISDITDYYTYNINQYTGKIVTNSELLKLKNIEEKDFQTKLVESFKKADPIENFKVMESGQTEEEKQQYQKNVDNLTNGAINDYNMYLNETGNLNIIFKRYGLAGAEYYEMILNMDTNKYTATTGHEIDMDN